MNITNLNPDTNIGASAWLVEIDGYRLLLDSGMHPKREGRAGEPMFNKAGTTDVDAIAISHCHHDHVGTLPVAARHFPKAHVLMTELSYFLVERVLHNSVNVMVRQRDELGIKEYPLYTHDEVDEIAPIFQGFKYNREIEWAAFHKTRVGNHYSPTLEFFDAGHTLGSAGILVRGKKETLFFTGDVCFHDQTILKKARFDNVKTDVLIMETTRGNREVPAGFSREREMERLVGAIRTAENEKHGSVLIPSFALGRTQEILATLALLMREEKLKRQPIYIGGLGRVFTEIYDLEAHRTNRLLSDMQLNEELELRVLEKGQAESMKLSGKIFVITAGMMSENTAAHDLAARMIGDERQSIFFVGYADPDSPAGRLKLAKRGETFSFSPSAGQVTRKCDVRNFDLTAHANRDELLNFVGHVSPRAILLGHGDDAARNWFEEKIRERWPNIKIFQPQPGLVLTP